MGRSNEVSVRVLVFYLQGRREENKQILHSVVPLFAGNSPFVFDDLLAYEEKNWGRRSMFFMFMLYVVQCSCTVYSTST